MAACHSSLFLLRSKSAWNKKQKSSPRKALKFTRRHSKGRYVLCSSVNPVKIFLSHASEDQPDFVRPLAEALSAFPDEFKVWYSEYELTLGDRLLAKIDAGLKNCDYGIVVLSPHFFAKHWPREELEGLFQLETTERKVILPIWKDVSESDVKTFSPILASRLGADAAVGIPRIVEEIRRAVGLIDRSKQLSTAAWKDKLRRLDEGGERGRV